LPLHDAGFVMGATVTDLCRTFKHKLYRWPDHLERFLDNCGRTHLDLPVDAAGLMQHAEELVRHNSSLVPDTVELALVVFATPGPVAYYLGEEGGLGDGPVTLGMHTYPLPFVRYRRWLEQGAALVVPSIRQLPRDCVDPAIKMRSRMHWWLADREAQRLDPGSAALLLDKDDCITETAAANVLLVQEGTVLSPPHERILEGISRRVVIELCGRLGIPFAERQLLVEDLENAAEILLTNTSYCLAGVSRCQGKPVPWPGPVLSELMKAWNQEVGLDIHAQILGP
jgi:branched-chain amino acid aminotransferase